ncbi:MAG TPA: S9 family peptidase [Candidatus Dormibacteraeota bacterium]|nr:S9 family peptidase [Candidatus Dormibacteraeota bacterium]
MPESPVAPTPEKRPVEHVAHDDRRVDEYAWMRDRDDPAVVAHLRAENAHTDAMTAGVADLRERIYGEIVARIQETDETAPAPEGAWEYVTRTRQGLEYPIHCRRPRGGGDEAVVLDENALAAGYGFTRVGDMETSPDQRLLAYTVDHDGDERFTLRVRDLETGADLRDAVENVHYSLAWASDSSALLYTRPDDAMRPHQVWLHRVGAPAAEDVLVLQEDDERFFASVERTRSGRLIVVSLASQVTTEIHLLDAADPGAPATLLAPRRHGVEYRVDHHPGDAVHGDHVYVVTNDTASNFRLVRVPLARDERWEELIPGRDDTKLEGVHTYAGFAAVYERHDGVLRARWFPIVNGHAHHELAAAVEQPERLSTASPGEAREFETGVLRYGYTSLVTPQSTVDHHLAEDRRVVVKEQPVLGGYRPSEYAAERHWATAGDGERIPISLVYRRGRAVLDGSAPCLLTGYGAYEISRDPTFSSVRLSLLDRGVVFAIAHVRGGGEMGRRWYEGGKLMHKRETFTDFIACGDHLVREGITSHDRLGIRGGSAGGLLIGAVLNMRPDLAAAAVADVPFVDALTAMLDPTLPLTVVEYDEWGDPGDAAVYAYMRTYSPYDNVGAADYPAILVLAGLNDPRVPYWQPAKWVARLRDRTTGTRPILLQTEMGAGHAGPSGRYESWRREAFIMSWLLGRLPGWEGD